jgi:hypothetical protein
MSVICKGISQGTGTYHMDKSDEKRFCVIRELGTYQR